MIHLLPVFALTLWMLAFYLQKLNDQEGGGYGGYIAAILFAIPFVIALYDLFTR